MSYLGNQPATGENNSFRILDDITSYTLTFDGSSASVVSVAGDTITYNDNRFIQGQRVTYTHGGGTAIGGLSNDGIYYIIKNDKNTIKLAASASDATNSIAVPISGLGVGSSHTLNVAFAFLSAHFQHEEHLMEQKFLYQYYQRNPDRFLLFLIDETND